MYSRGTALVGPVVKNLLSNAGDMPGLIPGWGIKIPHAVGQLSLSAATREARHHSEGPGQPKLKIFKYVYMYLPIYIYIYRGG